MRRLFFLIIVSLTAALLVSCTPQTTRPLGTVQFTRSPGKPRTTLLVFLPGLRDRAKVFADEGFVAAAEREGVKADMIGAEAHIGYYKKKELLKRLKEDIIDPAKRMGYSRIWLVGISLGGFGAIWYDIENPDDLAGIVSLSPYLGEPEMVDEVKKAGGLREWRPAAKGELDDQHRIWRGVKSYERRDKNLKRLYLGYGLRDKFALADSLLAAVIPGNQVFTMAGGHTWPVWRALWERILKSGAFEQDGGD